jgi:hypothetical protein
MSPRAATPHGPDADDDSVEVRHVQPYEARKVYRCPGCDHEIAIGTGHEVVVPRADPEGRRHWHTGCWHRTARRALRGDS